MKLLITILGCASLLVSGCLTQDTERYAKAAKATVMIESEHGYGSGFIVRRHDRLFVFTAAHVVSECSKLKIHQELRFENRKVGDSVFSAKVIARDDKSDLAVLWLDADPDYFGHVEFDLHLDFPAGTPVYHVGNFYGPKLPQSFSTGVVSQVGVKPSENFPWPVADQMTCFIIQGSSGGPVFDYSDKVIGVAVGTNIPGIEFFVPVRAVRQFAKSNRLQWLLYGFYCPGDAELNDLADKAKYVAPTPAPVVPATVIPSPSNNKLKPKSK